MNATELFQPPIPTAPPGACATLPDRQRQRRHRLWAGAAAFCLLTCGVPPGEAGAAAVDVVASAIQRGFYLGDPQVFYDSGWHDNVGLDFAVTGHEQVDYGPFAVYTHLQVAHGAYLGNAVAIAGGADYSASSLASAELQGASHDVIRVVSNTLPVGTPVAIEYRLYLAAVTVPGMRADLTLGGSPVFFHLVVDPGRLGPAVVTQRYDDWLRVGDTFLVDSGFRLNAGAEAGGNRPRDVMNASSTALGVFSIRPACDVCASPQWLSAQSPDLLAALAAVSQDSLVSLVADSGHDYSVLNVPEPGAMAMLLVGLAALAGRLGKRVAMRVPAG
jgi:hypothetical protein